MATWDFRHLPYAGGQAGRVGTRTKERSSEAEDSIELMNAEGVFLQIEVPAEEDPAEEDGREEDGREGEVSELKIRLAKANTKRVKELWGQQCAEFDEHLAEAEAKIEAAGTGSPLA